MSLLLLEAPLLEEDFRGIAQCVQTLIQAGVDVNKGN